MIYSIIMLFIILCITGMLLSLVSELRSIIEKYEIGKHDNKRVNDCLSFISIGIISFVGYAIGQEIIIRGINDFIIWVIVIVGFVIAFIAYVYFKEFIHNRYPEDEPFIKKETKTALRDVQGSIASFYSDHSDYVKSTEPDDSYIKGLSKMYYEINKIIDEKIRDN